ncbi:MAG: hypothetical protein WD578_13685 [Bacteroidales bacterium]
MEPIYKSYFYRRNWIVGIDPNYERIKQNLKDYQRVDRDGEKTVIYDKRDNPIELEIVKADDLNDLFRF